MGTNRSWDKGGTFIERSEIFTASGTWSFPDKIIKDSAGNAQVLVTMIGGGGSGCVGGGVSSTWGGNAGEAIQQMPFDVSASATVTIGAGGAALTAAIAANGNDGGDSAFGTLSVLGGGGGLFNTAYNNLQGGAQGGTNGTYSLENPFSTGGMFGGPPGRSVAAHGGGGAGGIVVDDSGIKGGNNTSTSIATGGVGYGSGGASAQSTTKDSGAGAAGVCMVQWREYA